MNPIAYVGSAACPEFADIPIENDGGREFDGTDKFVYDGTCSLVMTFMGQYSSRFS